MNKLGFAIKLASQGAGNAIVCNKGQWTNKVVDIREYLKLFNGLQGTDNIVTFMSFDEGGCFLTQLRTISGRLGDFLSGWIYIPNTIEATGEEIMKTYNYVRNILFLSNLNDSIEEIEEFFSKEYPKLECAAQYVPSSGEEFGWRFIDVYYSMKEIIDADRYQPYYSNFKAIFLLDKNSEVQIAKEQLARFVDLTNKTIEKICIFKAPSPEDVRLLGKGTKIVLSNKQEFNTSVLTKKGERIQLLALRDGFEPVILPPITIQEDGQKCSIDPKTVKWKKRINSSMFTVYNPNHEKIEDVNISINGTVIPKGQEIFIYEEDCRHAKVVFSAPDYEPFEYQRDLLLNEYRVITLNRKVKSYQTTIELANGKYAEMILESKYLSSKYDSPLKGYEFEEYYHGNKVLRMSSWFVWKQRLWGFLTALAAIVLIIAGAAFNAWLDTHHFKLGLPPWEDNRPAPTCNKNTNNGVEEDKVTGTDDQQVNLQILDYLNQKEKWEKARLDQDSMTIGLYDMINNYRFHDIIKNVNIEDCEKINQIKKLSQRMNDNGFSLSGPYSQDGTITIQKWIDFVNDEYEHRTAMDNGNNGQSDYKKKAAKPAKEEVPKEATNKNGDL